MPAPIRPRAMWLATFVIMGAQPGLAMNWEGHDDWFLNAEPFASFTELLPPPLPSPLPSCAERRNASARNIYEQTAVPGLNCIEGQEQETIGAD